MTTEPVHQFPSGNFTLEPHQAWLWNNAVQGPGALDVHPSTACMVALCGAGTSVSQVMDYLQTPAHRVVFGELGFAFHAPQRRDHALRVETRIDGIERKHGKRMPQFDRVSLRYLLVDAHTATTIVEVRQVWIVDRSHQDNPPQETRQ